MKQTLIAIALAASFCGIQVAKAEQGDISVHTLTAHVGVSGLNVVTPGVGYDLTDNVRIGGLVRNSYGFKSVYVLGYNRLNKYVSVGAGAISGYTWDGDAGQVVGKAGGVIPLLAAEFHLHENVSVTWFGQAFNLTLKF